jgi:lantibiotic modifying enzyme
MLASLAATRSTLTPTAEGQAGIGNHSLCHGDVGNLVAYEEVLKGIGHEAAGNMSLGREPWDRICHSGTSEGWLCGIPTAQYVPGLMTGLAGIAWGLAYSTASDIEPNLLVLESPRKLRSQGASI